jgi:hypothetical protein
MKGYKQTITEPRMSDIIHLVEEVRAKLSRITDAEAKLVWALRDALSRVDEKLLQDVRMITTEHEVRRGYSLHELQRLSSRIGTFPTPPMMSGVEDAMPPARPIAAADSLAVTNGFRRGDWRQATSNINDELDGVFEELASAPR